MNATPERQSHLFGTTLRVRPKDTESVSHALLVQGGFVRQLASGVFSLLPLGFRVHQRIIAIIREEMDALGAQELLLPTLQPRALWEETGRWTAIDPPLFVVKDRHESELALGPTHEEVITDLARTFLHSHKQLPLAVYQIQTKFRNEQRASRGLLRVREFVMKDLYSFHDSADDLRRFYEEVKQAYVRLFRRTYLEVVPVEADPGSIGGSVSHEFALLAETGEDTIAQCTACDFAAKVETLAGKAKDHCPRCQASLTLKPCVENGHIFQLGMKYSRALGARFTTATGSEEFFQMGCYGIGVGRLLASIVEASHDEKGIIWPPSVAPYDVHVLSLRGDQVAEDVAGFVRERGLTVLWDDRAEASAGEKLADSELIGIPAQIIVSERGIRGGTLEVRPRRQLSATRTFPLDNREALVAHLKDLRSP